MIQPLKRISSEEKVRNPYWSYKLDTYMRPNGTPGDYHYVHSPGSVLIVPRLGNNSFVLLRQYRYLNQRESIEFPGGGIKPDASIQQNARMELQQEAGYTAGSLYALGQINPCNGVTDELCSVFLADALTATQSEPDETEEFEPVILSARDIADYIKRGDIWDGMTISAWYLFLVSDGIPQH